jgi:hypothetical protein
MAELRPLHPHSRLTARPNAKPSPQPDIESWADTFVIAGLVVALGIMVLLLTG